MNFDIKSGVKLDWKARRREERTGSYCVITVKQLLDIEFDIDPRQRGMDSLLLYYFFFRFNMFA